jgi:hypothetical protein
MAKDRLNYFELSLANGKIRYKAANEKLNELNLKLHYFKKNFFLKKFHLLWINSIMRLTITIGLHTVLWQLVQIYDMSGKYWLLSN